MATVRRLSDDDVRAVFESIHENREPPPHLRFQIVPVGSDGQKLSPPSFEFEDGLYILLKPQSKKKKRVGAVDLPKVPSNLMQNVMPNIPDPTCPWSLSGPQFPQPTAIQQRYCYPKGERLEYSGKKGGALWTMYGADGQEDLEYRLLHVYFSAKRAVNRGVKVKKQSGVTLSPPPPQKRHKRNPATPPMHHLPQTTLRATVPPQSFDNVTMDSTNHYITPDSHDFGRFHPVPVGNVSPVRPLSIYAPWMHQPHELDAFHLSMDDPNMLELEDCGWTDPMVPNFHGGAEEERIRCFGAKLEQIHESIKECVLLAAHESERGHLTHMISDWGKQIAMNPFGEVDIGVEKV